MWVVVSAKRGLTKLVNGIIDCHSQTACFKELEKKLKIILSSQINDRGLCSKGDIGRSTDRSCSHKFRSKHANFWATPMAAETDASLVACQTTPVKTDC